MDQDRGDVYVRICPCVYGGWECEWSELRCVCLCVLCVCSWNRNGGWGAWSQHDETIMKTFSEVLLCSRSRGVNTDFIKIVPFTGEAPGSLSYSLQDSCFSLAVKFKLTCFDGLESTWEAPWEKLLTLAEKNEKSQLKSYVSWYLRRELKLSFSNVLHKWEEGHEKISVWSM